MQIRLKLGTLLILAILVAFVGCDSAQQVITGVTMPAADPIVEESAAPEMEATPVKLVWLINYPLGGKDAYLEWVASVSEALSAPEELQRVASYDNYYGVNPHRLVEFEFASFVDAMTYMNRPEIAAVFEALPDHSSEASTHVLIQRSDYAEVLAPERTIKVVYLIDYPLGGKDAYLDWVASIAPELSEPEQVQRIASYDNYYGESPHRFVEFEFASMEDANLYHTLEGPRAINLDLPNRTSRETIHFFELRGDYVNVAASQ